MKSEHNANPAPADDEEIIELTDVLKTGPDAEEIIVDLTDVVETVKAEPHNPGTAFDEDQPLELGENAIAEADEAETLVDLTDALDSPELALSDSADDVSDETQALLDLDEILDDDADNDLAMDLKDALDTPDDESTILDLDESLVDDGLTDDDLRGEAPDGNAFDDGDTTADIAEAIEVNAEVLDLAEILDAGEAEEDFLALDTPIDDADMVEEASVPDESSYDLLILEPSTFGDALEVIETDPEEDPLAGLETPPDDDGSSGLDLVDLPENTDADESDDILDLGVALEPTADEDSTEVLSNQDSGAASDPAAGGLFEADDAGDNLDFKLDEMLAEAQAEMPVLDDDDADIELDLSEALADAAADSSGKDPEATLDLNAPVAPVVKVFDGDDAAEEDEADAFDLISEDKVIELNEPVVLENLTEAASKHDNVIDLADITGGYPTISPTSEFDLDAPGEVSLSEVVSPSEKFSPAEELSAEADALLEDVFLDEGNTADSIVAAEPEDDDEDMDLGITFDDPEAEEDETDEDFRLGPEMEKLEATLNDVFQDDEGDDLDLAMFADSASDDAAEGAAPAADRVAVDLADAGPPVATKVPVGDLPDEVTEEVLDAAVSRVIKTMYADRIEQMILDVIKEAVTAEIDKVKRSLGDKA